MRSQLQSAPRRGLTLVLFALAFVPRLEAAPPAGLSGICEATSGILSAAPLVLRKGDIPDPTWIKMIVTRAGLPERSMLMASNELIKNLRLLPTAQLRLCAVRRVVVPALSLLANASAKSALATAAVIGVGVTLHSSYGMNRAYTLTRGLLSVGVGVASDHPGYVWRSLANDLLPGWFINAVNASLDTFDSCLHRISGRPVDQWREPYRRIATLATSGIADGLCWAVIGAGVGALAGGVAQLAVTGMQPVESWELYFSPDS